MVIGGIIDFTEESETYSSNVYKYNPGTYECPSSSEEIMELFLNRNVFSALESWDFQSTKLELARGGAAAVAVPDEFAGCVY